MNRPTPQVVSVTVPRLVDVSIRTELDDVNCIVTVEATKTYEVEENADSRIVRHPSFATGDSP